eukprot:8796017-Alexandrium_andersonii.AAC.1
MLENGLSRKSRTSRTARHDSREHEETLDQPTARSHRDVTSRERARGVDPPQAEGTRWQTW